MPVQNKLIMGLISGKDLVLFLFYFAASVLLTWYFVVLCPLYVSNEQMLLSTAIAGGKWALQILLEMLFLKEKSGAFMRGIGFVCLLGSCVLIPYIISAYFVWSNSPYFFFGSLIACVLMMIFGYYRTVRKQQLALKWWLFWLISLACAISLQLTIVFHFITF